MSEIEILISIILGILSILLGIGLICGAFFKGVVKKEPSLLWGIGNVIALILVFKGFRLFGISFLSSSWWTVIIFTSTGFILAFIFDEKTKTDILGTIVGIFLFIFILAVFIFVYFTAVKPSIPLVESIFK